MSLPVDPIQQAAKQAAQEKVKEDAAELTRRLHAALKRELEAAQAENPRFRNLGIKQDVLAYRKRPKGWSSVPLRVVRGFVTTKTFLAGTNAAIVRHVATWFPGHAVNVSLMTKSLTKTARSQVQAELVQAGLPITVREGDTLSTLKRAIRAGGRDDIPAAGKIEVALGNGYVVVNGQELKIEGGRGTDAVRIPVDGKRQYLRVDVLTALLNLKSSRD